MKHALKKAPLWAAALLAGLILAALPGRAHAAQAELPSAVTSLSAADANIYGSDLKLTGNLVMDCDFSGTLDLNGFTLTLNADRINSGTISGSGTVALAGHTLYNAGTVSATVSGGAVRVPGTLPTAANSVSYDGSSFETAVYTQSGTLWLLSGSDWNTPAGVAAYMDGSGVRYVYSQGSYLAMYGIRYLDEDGTPLAGLSPASYNAEGGPVALPLGLIRNGYTFSGWRGSGVTADGTALAQGTAGDVVLTALWTQSGAAPGGGAGGSATGGFSGLAGGSAYGGSLSGLTAAEETEEDAQTADAGQAVSGAASAQAEVAEGAAAAGTSGTRLSRGSSGIRLRLTGSDIAIPDEAAVTGAAQSSASLKAGTWLPAALLLAAGAVGGVWLWSRVSKRRMREMYEKLHIER